MSDIINNAKETGKMNININNVIYNELNPGVAAEMGADQPKVTDVELGRWRISEPPYTFYNTSQVPVPSAESWDFFNGSPGHVYRMAWNRDEFKYSYRFVFHEENQAAENKGSIFAFHNSEDTAVRLTMKFTKEGWPTISTFTIKTYFRPVPGLTDVYYTVFLDPSQSFKQYISKYQINYYDLEYTYTGRVTPSANVYTYTNNFTMMGNPGEEAGSASIDDIRIQNKDTYLRVFYNFRATGIPDNTYYFFTMELGKSGINDHIEIHGPHHLFSGGGDNYAVNDFLLPVKLSGYDWFRFKLSGTPNIDQDFNITFIENNIQ